MLGAINITKTSSFQGAPRVLLLLLFFLPQVKGDQNQGAIHAVLPDYMYIKVDAEKIIFRVQSKEPGHQKTSPLDVSLWCWF